MNDRIGIGYCVYCPERDTFLGKLGSWYSDVRLASVYAEPRSAKMALNRADSAAPCVVVQLRMIVEQRHIDFALQAIGKAENHPPKAEAKPEGSPAVKAPGPGTARAK